MPHYRCEYFSSAGRREWRTLEAATEQIAAARLITEGLTPLAIHSGPMGLAERLRQPVAIGGRPGVAEQALLLTQLAVLIRSGLAVDRSLDLLRDQSPSRSRREALGAMLDDVRGGSGLAKAMERRGLFPAYVVGVVTAAEMSGRLGDALTSVSERMTELAAARRQLATALAYPAAVLVATIMALLLVLTVVVPQFEPSFAGQHDRLPALTVAVLQMSTVARSWGVWLLLLLPAIPLLLLVWARSERGGRLVWRYRRHLPGMDMRQQYLAARFTGTLAALLANGVSIVRALPLVGGAIGSRSWRREIATVERHVREGMTFSRALTQTGFVPNTVIRLLEVGEKTGRLSETCLHAHEILSDSSRARIDRLVALANPLAIVILGGMVALLMAGVMLGIFAIGDFGG
jgi:general secretion pathway protein F